MSLFALTENTNPVFQKVLDTYFSGQPDPLTLSIINSTLNTPINKQDPK